MHVAEILELHYCRFQAHNSETLSYGNLNVSYEQFAYYIEQLENAFSR